MEEEIDLREYVRVLLRWWKWIVGVTVVAAAVAGAVSLLQPASYQAAATVGWVTLPLELECRASEAARVEQKPNTSLSDLALSEQVTGGLGGSQISLRGALKATAATDGRSVQLSVRASSAEEAARIANAWANALASYASSEYREQARQQAELLEGQAREAQMRLEAAQKALAEFQGRNQATVLEARRAVVEQELRDSLAEQRQIAQAIQKMRALQGRLAGLPSSAPVEPGDALAALVLQTQMAGVSASGATVQVELSDAAIASVGKSVGELNAFLDRLVAALSARDDALKSQIETIETQLLSLQRQAQEAKAEGDRLAVDRDAAQRVYASLAEQAGRLKATAVGDQAEVTASAIAPAVPVGRSRLFNVAAAAVLGMMLGVFGAFAIEWWRGGAQDEGKAGPA